MAAQNIHVEIAMFTRLGELFREGMDLTDATVQVCDEMKEYYDNHVGDAVVKFSLPYKK